MKYLLLLVIACSFNLEATIFNSKAIVHPEVGENGMVVSQHYLATNVGHSILEEGGNAYDASIAVAFALAVVLPRAGNIGGGGFMIMFDETSQQSYSIDYREVAPEAATKNMFLSSDGSVNKIKARQGVLSIGVPGTVYGMWEVHKKFGSLPWSKLLAPAIQLAEDGFLVSPFMADALNRRYEKLGKYKDFNRIFYSNYPVRMSQRLKQPNLANTLKIISVNGAKGFYEGEVAKKIDGFMKQNGGLITKKDLKNYRPIWRETLQGTFNEFEIVSMGPPSSGGIHVIQMLNILEPYPLESYGHNSAAYLHRVIESMKLAYADRSRYLGDPDQTVIPIEALISKDYAAERRELITPNQANTPDEIGPGNPVPNESPDTTHYSVADADGNVVANTYTLNFSFGSHIVVPGTGMLLNNEMDDFAAKAGAANAYGLVQGEANTIAPGRRPLSSMTPTLVFKDGQPWLAAGSPGGSLIITTVLQTLLNAMVFDMNIATAVAAPRVHNQWMPDRTLVEPGISADTQRVLEEWGHQLSPTRRTIGRSNSLMIDVGWMQGFADMRRPGGHVATE